MSSDLQDISVQSDNGWCVEFELKWVKWPQVDRESVTYDWNDSANWALHETRLKSANNRTTMKKGSDHQTKTSWRSSKRMGKHKEGKKFSRSRHNPVGSGTLDGSNNNNQPSIEEKYPIIAQVSDCVWDGVSNRWFTSFSLTSYRVVTAKIESTHALRLLELFWILPMIVWLWFRR